MKTSIIALFLGVAASVKLSDGPNYFNEPPYTERSPSAAGLLQTSQCISSGVDGVTCSPPNNQLWANGMNGDEDLEQDITMHGDKFHYTQQGWNPIKVATKAGTLPSCHGTNGPDGVNCVRDACDGTNGPKDGESGTPCTRAEPDAIDHYNADPQAGRPYQTTGDITPTTPVAAAFVQLNKDNKVAAPEKVSVLHTPIAKTHTTFYTQKN